MMIIGYMFRIDEIIGNRLVKRRKGAIRIYTLLLKREILNKFVWGKKSAISHDKIVIGLVIPIYLATEMSACSDRSLDDVLL